MKEVNISDTDVSSFRTIRFGILRPAKRPTYSSDNDRKNHVAFAIKMRQEHGSDFWTDEVDGVSYLNGVVFAYKGNLWNKRGLTATQILNISYC